METTCLRLKSEWRDQLLAAVQRNSEIWNVLRHAMPIDSFMAIAGRHYELLCNEADARMLLDAAETHCPGAVQEIELTIQRLQPART
jgi:hypothetical protein